MSYNSKIAGSVEVNAVGQMRMCIGCMAACGNNVCSLGCMAVCQNVCSGSCNSNCSDKCGNGCSGCTGLCESNCTGTCEVGTGITAIDTTIRF